jgi:hypothetical protein
MLHTLKEGNGNWNGYILRKNCLLKHVIEGKIAGRIEVMGRRVRRCKQLLHNIKTIMEIERGSTVSYSVETLL